MVNAVVNQSPTQPGFLTTQQGYPAGLASPDKFNPVDGQHHLHAAGHPLDLRDELVLLRAAAACEQRRWWTWPTWATAPTRSLLFANYNQALPNRPGQSLTLAQRQNTRPFPTFGDITYSFNGGFSDYNSLQFRFEHRFGHGLFFLNSFTLVEGHRQRRGLARESQRQQPLAAGLQQPEGGQGHLRLRSAADQHHQLRLPVAVR